MPTPAATSRRRSSSETGARATAKNRPRSRVTIRALIQFCFFSDSPDRFVLKGFSKDGRDLTDKETRAFLKAADKDGDGKIGVDGKRPVPLVAVGRGAHNKANAQLH